MHQLIKILLIATPVFVPRMVRAADAASLQARIAAQQARERKEQQAVRSYQILVDTSQSPQARNLAKTLIEKLAQENLPHVLFLKSRLLKEGLDGFYPINEQEAARLCVIAADAGDLGASMDVAEYYEQGSFGIPRDITKAIHFYERILKYAEKTPDALPEEEVFSDYYKLANLYLEKVVTVPAGEKPSLYKKAVDCFSKVQGDLMPFASFALGNMLENDKVIVQNKNAEIKKYYTKALQGFDAIQNLSVTELKRYVQICTYFFGIFKNSDRKQALHYVTKGLAKDQNALILHVYYWSLYPRDEDIDFETAFEHLKFVVDATSERFRSDPIHVVARIQALFDYGTILYYGAYGIAQDKAAAQKLFDQILQRSDNDFVNDFDLTMIGTMYERGLGVPRDLKRALRYYKKLSPGIIDYKVGPLQKKITEENRKKSLASQAGALSINDQPAEEDDFEFLPPTQEEIQPLKTPEINPDQTTADLISYFNERHPMDDHSTITAIDVPSKKITINDSRNNLEITLDAGQKYADVPFDPYTLVRKKIRKFVYDKRIQPWFKDEYNGDNHFFAQMVDALIQLYGTNFTLSNETLLGNKPFMLKGTVKDLSSGKVRHGQFEYDFYKEKNSDRWILYHRLFRPFKPLKKS